MSKKTIASSSQDTPLAIADTRSGHALLQSHGTEPVSEGPREVLAGTGRHSAAGRQGFIADSRRAGHDERWVLAPAGAGGTLPEMLI